ncbi:MAG: hypothetical protein JXB49_14460 [Bacteroidales bacterium]|nr:hypothetical protein [Bacteroidales bacterium]
MESEILILGIENLIFIVSENVKRARRDDFVSIFDDKHNLYGIIDFSLFSITQLRHAMNPDRVIGDNNLYLIFDKACEDIGRIQTLACENEKNSDYLILLENILVEALKNIITTEERWDNSIKINN